MTKTEKLLLALVCLVLLSLSFLSVVVLRLRGGAGFVGASPQYGMPGIYKSFTLTDGDGSAIKLDSAGRVVASSTSN